MDVGEIVNAARERLFGKSLEDLEAVERRVREDQADLVELARLRDERAETARLEAEARDRVELEGRIAALRTEQAAGQAEVDRHEDRLVDALTSAAVSVFRLEEAMGRRDSAGAEFARLEERSFDGPGFYALPRFVDARDRIGQRVAIGFLEAVGQPGPGRSLAGRAATLPVIAGSPDPLPRVLLPVDPADLVPEVPRRRE